MFTQRHSHSHAGSHDEASLAEASSSAAWWAQWDPNTVTIWDDTVPTSWKKCALDGVYFGGSEYQGSLNARISSIFVILFVSTSFTLLPVIFTKVKGIKVPKACYLFARYFGTGVIIATAFIHLMEHSYMSIGSNSCVGSSGRWADYSWCSGIVLTTVFVVFLVDLLSEVYIERKFGISCSHGDLVEGAISDNNPRLKENDAETGSPVISNKDDVSYDVVSGVNSEIAVKPFESQIGAFLVMEFGIIFHSVMIGLELGTTGEEFSILYPVIVFHQSFEGLGIGARLISIAFPEGKKWWPYALCILYGATTPIAIAIGLGVRMSYNAHSFKMSIISGVLDAIAAGILIYTGLVELLARDFMFDPNRTKNLKKLTFMIICTFSGAGLMALLGRWA
ncbi:KLTH0A07722p [Lachancea thermotolerans CBS 6340]|uniref:KLTH0A07722p n=1 Tax=Lachancea thermotolerans (strain ATCC 56472 / CBS 6340 / NRRL Y-8284) TaxID=559295 RepID=C5DC46_LACTC|nr:KLTH0A07722p [Lachancea thermotolerans CBS 6340]CAR21353.1 KLTH0A07722p [Lachancea thermotolerans CBS 6340]